MIDGITPLGEPLNHRQVLLDEEDRRPELLVDLFEILGDRLDDRGLDTLRGFIDQQQVGVADERAGDGEHLLLAAGHCPGVLIGSLFEDREVVVDLLVARLAVAADRLADQQVLFDGQIREHITTLGHIADTALCAFVR